MSTYTVHPHERHNRMSEWSLHHPLMTTMGAVVAAIIAGALIGVLFSIAVAGEPAAQQHRAGGHIASKAAGVHAIVATTGSHTAVGATTDSERSPARGGFAVGRTAGADDGFIEITPGERAPVRGGFPGRSLGAGHVPGGALARSTASM